MSYIIRSVFGPTLYRIYQASGPVQGTPGIPYVSGTAERYGSMIIAVINSMFTMGYYSSPFWISVAYRRDWFSTQGLLTIAEILVGFGCLYTTALCLRAVGRGTNPTYRQFLDVLSEAHRDFSPQTKARLAAYDFEFKSWPVEFTMEQGAALNFIPHKERSDCRGLTSLINRFFAWLMVNSFGISLVYPGSLRLIQAGISEALVQGRAKLVLEKGGKRFKLKTADKNELDVMFFDRRGNSAAAATKGSTLVVSCEGNAGYYEVGMASTPIDAGYSVLGWNHPGFGGSTGDPFPDQEAHAVDAVMQFAIRHLGFQPEDIIIHGWSIGGYTSSWAAMQYPDVKAVILDATFDDLLPLAVPRMPEVMESLVRTGITDYINLNIGDQLVAYKGPITLIRRQADEVITMDGVSASTNRGNFLLKRLLEHRYPRLFDSMGEGGQAAINALQEYLSLKESSQKDMMRRLAVDEDKMQTLISSSQQGPRQFPSTLGEKLSAEDKTQLTLFLASKYMVEFDSSHCTPLPVRFFTMPWESNGGNNGADESSFVKL